MAYGSILFDIRNISMEDPIIGFTAIQIRHNGPWFLVTMEILGKTDMDRTNIKNKQYASYSTCKTKILKIEDHEGNVFNEIIITPLFDPKEYVYKVDEIIGGMISFVLDKEACMGFVRRDGLCRHWHIDGTLSSAYIRKDGKLDGKSMHWHLNGQMHIEQYYKNDKQHGYLTVWHDDGQMYSERNYYNGKKNGMHREWYNNRQLKFESSYYNDKKNGTHREWNENGIKKLECVYSDGWPTGPYIKWYTNGQKHIECIYVLNTTKDGHGSKFDGLYMEWYDNGQLYIKCNYVNGNLTGLYEQWNYNGDEYAKQEYEYRENKWSRAPWARYILDLDKDTLTDDNLIYS